MPRIRTSPTVHKFGGASLADGAAIKHAAAIVCDQPRGPTVVVVSAMVGVTNALLDLATKASAGDSGVLQPLIEQLRSSHLQAARAVASRGAERDALTRHIQETFVELEEITLGLVALRELTPRSTDYIVARGERLSARLFAAALRSAGREAEYVDALDVVKTDATFGNAFPDLARTTAAARSSLRPLLTRGVIPVVPGYIGATPDGQVATLGRGGTDLSATLVARALGAPEVSLWKDVPGLLTADPKIVADARVVPQLHTREAAELAYYGAKVLHPRALIPLADRGTRVYVRPFSDPTSTGTEISARRTLVRYPVKAISAVPDQALITVTGSGMLGVPGICARAFTALYQAGISVSLITQASSEHSICLGMPAASADAAARCLRDALRSEIERGDVDDVDVRRNVSTLAVVGLGMAGTPGIATRLFSALSLHGINVVAIAQGSSELNISVVVDSADAPAAVRHVHEAFQLSKIGGGAVAHAERTDVVILGFGQIGRALANMIAKVKQNGVALRVVAVIDRSGYVFDARGISPRRLAALSSAKSRGTPLGEQSGGHRASPMDALGFVVRHALTNPILVDVTADDTTELLKAALSAGMDLVLANKRPLAGRKVNADQIAAAARATGRRVLHETTVGAGLPIIDTYYKLIESGDRVLKIEGCPSGTMGYLFGELGRGHRFSESLRGAMAKGYTEPDPRDDLSGMDVARKAIILGRLLGYQGELEDVAVESLVPEEARDLPLPEFLARLERYDPEWEQRVRQARERGGVLRYRAVVTRKKIHVGLQVVDLGSPSASLNGTDNQFIFTTARYRTNPLVITGPGAGPAVTAAGVLNDVLKLAGA